MSSQLQWYLYIHFGTIVARSSRTRGSNVAFGSLRPFGPGLNVARGSKRTRLRRFAAPVYLTNQEIMSHPYIHFGTIVARGSRTPLRDIQVPDIQLSDTQVPDTQAPGRPGPQTTRSFGHPGPWTSRSLDIQVFRTSRSFGRPGPWTSKSPDVQVFRTSRSFGRPGPENLTRTLSY